MRLERAQLREKLFLKKETETCTLVLTCNEQPGKHRQGTSHSLGLSLLICKMGTGAYIKSRVILNSHKSINLEDRQDLFLANFCPLIVRR